MKQLTLLFSCLLAAGWLSAQSETPPEVTNVNTVMEKIGYPESARAEGVEGKVVAAVTVNDKGRVAEWEILESPDPRFREAVESHLEDLRFEPATRDGEAIKSIVKIPFRFELPDQDRVFTSITEALQEPEKVIHLDLSGKKNLEFSRELSTCQNMKTLNLDDTGIDKVPSFIKSLDRLEDLSLADNQLKKVPGWLARLESIEDIDLRGNPFDEGTTQRIREQFEEVSVLVD